MKYIKAALRFIGQAITFIAKLTFAFFAFFLKIVLWVLRMI
jgi:hypothetical protein